MPQLLIPVCLKNPVVNCVEELISSGKGQSFEPELLLEDGESPMRIDLFAVITAYVHDVVKVPCSSPPFIERASFLGKNLIHRVAEYGYRRLKGIAVEMSDWSRRRFFNDDFVFRQVDFDSWRRT